MADSLHRGQTVYTEARGGRGVLTQVQFSDSSAALRDTVTTVALWVSVRKGWCEEWRECEM